MEPPRSTLTPAERLAADINLALTTPFIPREARKGRISPNREIHCRGCSLWIHYGTNGPWTHEDGTVACCDPVTFAPINA